MPAHDHDGDPAGTPPSGEARSGPSTADTLPTSDDEWFALIEPCIDVEPALADADDVTRIAKRHARQVVDRIDAFDFDIDAIEWRPSKHLRATHSTYCPQVGRITLSLLSLRKHGWQLLMQAIRHELVHHWQYQQGLVRPKRGVDRAHDTASFERWISPLSIRKHMPELEPRYAVECRSCGVLRRENKLTSQVRRWIPDQAECYRCGAPPRQVIVRDTAEDTVLSPGERYETLSDEQRQVYYAIHPDGPRAYSRPLIAFPGISKQTAAELAPDLTYVTEMVDGQALTPRLQDAVLDQYHDDLWAYARSYVDWEQPPGTSRTFGYRSRRSTYFDEDGNRCFDG